VIGGKIVIAGGRTDAAAATAATNKVFTMTVPSLTLPDPSFLDSGVTLATARWGAAYAVVGQTLWIIGGSNNQQTCLPSVEKLTANGNTLTRSDGPALPIIAGTELGLCQATAVAFSNGKIVVTGGTIDASYVTASDSANITDNTTTFVLDTGAGTWTRLTGATPSRFSQAGASNATTALIISGALFTHTGPITNPVDLTNVVQSVTSAGAYTTKTAFPQMRYAPAAAFISATGYYVFGGGSIADVTATGSAELRSTSDGTAWNLVTPVMGAPHGRYGHVLVAADPGDGSGVKLYAIAGATSTVNITAVDEYFP
jgi:hypothetical protein